MVRRLLEARSRSLPGRPAEDKVNASTRSDDNDLYGVQVYERGNQKVTNRIITKNPGTLRSWYLSSSRRVIKIERRGN